jgi:two-component system chemotaxis response regulator CheB
MRRMVGDALRRTPGLEVVGEAADGDEAIARCAELNPDVMTLDLSMPGSTGLDVLAKLRQQRSPIRVVVVSSFSPTLVERALDVLDEGATDLVAKPKVGESLQEFGDQVGRTVLAAAGPRHPPPARSRIPVPRASRRASDDGRILVIASSTGGPRALGELVPALGARIGAGGVIVQHMPEGFTAPLAARLDKASTLTVREAVEGDTFTPASLLVAPAGAHLRVHGMRLSLDDAPAIGALRPRADLTISDLAREHGPRVVLVVLTGMGNDGLAGAKDVRAAGGIVLTQDESDCVVYGMPRHVVEHDLADATGTIAVLPVLIERALGTPVARA